MADYNWGCGECGAFPGHEDSCSISVNHGRWLIDQKHAREGFERSGDFYLCTHGCGCVVWDIVAHRKNVCRDD